MNDNVVSISSGSLTTMILAIQSMPLEQLWLLGVYGVVGGAAGWIGKEGLKLLIHFIRCRFLCDYVDCKDCHKYSGGQTIKQIKNAVKETEPTNEKNH
jgi:GTPase involved in cell partitioning and DNA repair